MRFACGFALFAAMMASCGPNRESGALPMLSLAVTSSSEDALKTVSSRASLTAGEHHSCVISEGSVYCWGYGLAGQLGRGDMINSAVPMKIEALGQDNHSVFAGDLHSCAIKASGAVFCWGYNQTGAVGNGRSGREFAFSGQAKAYNVTSPSRVLGLDGLKIVQIAATKNTSCALTEQGQVYCWGTGANYELGDGMKDEALTPHHRGTAQRVTILREAARSIHAGDRAFCAVTDFDRIQCWGKLSLPQEKAFPVVDLSSSQVPFSLAMADQHSCFLDESDQLHCRGDNWYQQTGLANVANDWTLVRGESFTKIATARKTTCGITPTRSVRCWGVCLHGLCGPSFTAKLISPTQAQNVFAYSTQRSIEITGIADAVDIAVGARHACALLENGSIRCWGNGFLGELGHGEGESSAEPVSVVL